MLKDLRYTLRSLAHRRGFTFVVIFTLGLGIGSATAIYSVVRWYLFRGPAAPRGVYMLGLASRGGDANPLLPVPFLKAYRARSDVFADIELSWSQSDNVIINKEPVSLGVMAVSPGFFSMLGAKPYLGRVFASNESVEGRNNVVVVSYYFWKEHLGATPDALGRTVLIDDTMCAVVGVLAKGQRFPAYCSGNVYRPIVLDPKALDPWDPWLVCLCTLRNGFSPKTAEAALAAMKPDVPASMKDFASISRPTVSTVDEVEKFWRPGLYWTLVGAVGFLYAIGCLNSTNLVLVHILGRRREISVRIALGGTRGGVLRLLMTETLVLSISGAALGAAIANWMAPVFWFMAGNREPENGWLSWNLGTSTYAVLAGLSLITALLTALAPAGYLLGANVQKGLKNGGASVGESPALSQVRSIFVILQTSFAVILLVGAGLMIRSFSRLEHIELGYDTINRTKLQMSFPRKETTSNEKRLVLFNRVRDALQRAPGVAYVGYGSAGILAGFEAVSLSVLAKDNSQMKVNGAYISSDFGQAGGLRLLAGAWLRDDSKGEVLINESLAKKRFPGENPVGQYLRTDADPKQNGWHVIGLVADSREMVRREPVPKVYMPVKWSPNIVSTFVIQTRTRPDGLMLDRLKQAVYSCDPRIVVWSENSLSDLRDTQLYDERLTLSVLRVLSGIALVLTLVGIFSVLAYVVDCRMAEFGIRMAVGATPGLIVALVLRRGIALTAIGIVLGIGGAVALTRFLQSLLYEAAPFDPLVIGSVALLLLVSAAGACILPAIKASKPDLVALLKGSD